MRTGKDTALLSSSIKTLGKLVGGFGGVAVVNWEWQLQVGEVKGGFGLDWVRTDG